MANEWIARTEQVVRFLAFEAKDEPIQRKAIGTLSKYGPRGTEALASIIRHPHQTVMTRLTAAYSLLTAKLR